MVVYRSPNGNAANDQNWIDEFLKLNGRHLIIGDFNLPGIDWGRMCVKNLVNIVCKDGLIDSIRDHHLIQHVQEPTRIRGMQEQNILDLIFTDDEFLKNLKIESPLLRVIIAHWFLSCNSKVTKNHL